jgi:hypothetical protein
MTCLRKELIESRRAVSKSCVEWALHKEQIAPEIYSRTLPGAARVAFDGLLYEPDENGSAAMILPATDRGRLVDLVAFTPKRFGLREGKALALGVEHIDAPTLDNEPLSIHLHPLPWLKSGAKGVCLLDRGLAWPLLQWQDRLRVSSQHDAAHLNDLMANTNWPGEIEVAA